MFRERRVASTGLVLVGLLGAHAIAASAGEPEGIFNNALRLGGFFAAGMLLHAIGDRIPVSWRFAAPSTAGVVAFSLVAPSPALLALPLAYLLLWLSAAIPLRWGAVNDYSYGVYISAFPVQHLMAARVRNHFRTFTLPLLTLLSVPRSAGCCVWAVELRA